MCRVKLNKKVDSLINELRSQALEKPYIEIVEHWTEIDKRKKVYEEAVTDFKTEVNVPFMGVYNKENGVYCVFNSYKIHLRHKDSSKSLLIEVFDHGIRSENTMTLTGENGHTVYCCKNFKTQQNVCSEIKRIVTEFEEII